MTTTAWPSPLPSARNLAAESEGWAKHASALATFALEHLVNRTDVWGNYVPFSLREQYGSVWTMPAVRHRGVRSLTHAVIVRHCRSNDPGDVLGFHVISPDGTSRFFCIDVDAHGILTDAERAARLDAAQRIVERLAEYGVAVMLEDSDGRGGFHVLGYFDTPVSSDALHYWLTSITSWVTAQCGVLLEAFPKQPRLDDATKFGNWMRFFGRHHTHAHFSRLARPGGDWMSGVDAAHLVLHRWPATPADVVPVHVVEPAPSTTEGVSSSTAYRIPTADDDVTARCAAYLRKLPPLRSGEKRNDTAYRIAAFVLHTLNQRTTDAWVALTIWNERNHEPLADRDLEKILANAARYGASAA